jgi:hypothetical protein
VTFDPRWSGQRDYPEKGDLESRSNSSNDLPHRNLCPLKWVSNITRKKVTFVEPKQQKKNVRKKSKKE